MAESVVLPVVLYDGVNEVGVGSIKINQTMEFKQLQKMLKEAVGHNNLTTYLVESNRSKSPSKRTKRLITGNVNFFSLARESKCYFRLVLKQSPRRKSNVVTPPVSPWYVMQLRKNQFDIIRRQMSSGYHHGVPYFPTIFYPAVIRSYSPAYTSFPRVQERRALCKNCIAAGKEGTEAPFHSCVYDQVVAGGFRSTAGPISRLR